eukprot:CAMPEP_0113648326 /NCGR_PEP_ID=MMETSP0017_2-20120614/25628_1 /TAXON_ID=2856 /ORGANISM="Cylindrotheca closterium" /LENGTH=1434 /DNA_ID=CAMNT_0000560529 /DNA_START=278 /DNA_END=4582 /DNA_ORIENTATION=+ /assembly_acc=CAM_ASM_000147
MAPDATTHAAAAPSDEVLIHEVERYSWWCGGGLKPQNGKDLGVFEASLEDRANCLSLWSLSYLNPLLSLGSRKVLDAGDVGVPSKADSSHDSYEKTKAAWDKQVKIADAHNKKLLDAHAKALEKCKTEEARAKIKPPTLKEPSVAKALANSFGMGTFLISLVYYIISSLLSFVPVLILNDLVKYFEHVSVYGTAKPYDHFVNPWIEVAGLGVVPLIVSILQTRHQAIMAHCGVFVRTAASTMLYRKSLNVSAAGRAKTSTGQVVNMMSNDTMQLQRFLQFIGLTMSAPIQIVVALYLIFQQVGNATWVGVGYMVVLAPVNMVVFSIVSKMRRKVLKYSDLRVKMMNEILTGVRIIKFYAWEKPFGKEVGRLRQKEVEALTHLAYTTAVGFSIILLSTPIIQPIIVFLTYVNIQDEPLSASTAFTTVALFNIMRFPFAFLPMGLLQYIQSKISLKRLERYLALPELQGYVEDEAHPDADPDSPTAQPGSITIEDGSFTWIDPDGPEIKPVQDEKPKKEKKKKGKKGKKDAEDAAAVDASSASSKALSLARSQSSNSLTSIESGSKASGGITLQHLTCEIAPGSLVAVVGSVGSGKSSFLSAILGEMESIDGSKVYIPRNENEKDINGYASYCTQSPWVVNDTLRGNILFGREFEEDRYNLVLENCALVDDIAILPAGDMTEIGERGINLSGGQKARVSLARAMYAKHTKLLLLDDPLSAVDSHVGQHIFSKAIAGEMSEGITRVLVTHHVHVLSRCDKVIIFEHGRITHQGSYQELVDSGVDFAGAVDVSKVEKTGTEVAKDTTDAKAGKSKSADSKEDAAKQKKAGAELVKEEEREEGDVAGQAYMRYARAGGMCLAFLVFLIQGIGRGFEIGAAFWLAHWAEQMIEANLRGEPLSDSDVSYYIGIYALLGFLGILGLGGRGIAIAKHRLHASRKLHDGLTDAVLRAPVAFFDVTPIGRVLNRFAADMDKLDLELTQTVSQGVSTVFSVLGALGAIVAATKGTFLVALIPFGYSYNVIQKWFRKTSTELQRVTSVANSPIFADFSQTLSGTSTIRAYGVQKDFFSKCKTSFDNMNASYVLVQLSGYWLALRLDIMGGLVSMFVGLVAVATLDSAFIPAGWLGLALSYSIEVTSFLKHGVMMIARLEADMSSVERILYYTDNIEPEAPDEIPESDPKPGTWPSSGEVEFSNASMRYRDGPLVLKDLSLTVKAGEKIGVCGRTGSGKSSLMIALFRISELEEDGGQILIDGLNARNVGTGALRMNLSIIPQDPVMFSNTVRYNLDPFATATEEELWDVLKKVRLVDAIAELPKGLDDEVAEGGENFSQGQRQLLCIARSLLRKPKILVMDEATASIDNETDAAIQEMIRENFADATVLTIAHRLNTIMDSDRVLVLDEGRIAELDTPENLLEKENGHFRAMVEKSRAAHSSSIEEE